MKRNFFIFAYLGFLFLIFAKRTYAYLDPGTGSYLFQVLIAGFVGGAFFIKTFWKNISNFVTSLFSKKETSSAKKKKDG